MFWDIAPLVFATVVACGLSYFMQYLAFFEEEMGGPAYFYSFLLYPLSFYGAALTAGKIWGRVAMPYGGGVAIAVAVVVFVLMLRRKQRLARTA